jgi:hypothetical protein
MTFKDALLGLLLIAVVIGVMTSVKARNEINRIRAESDSIATVRDSAFKVRTRESAAKDDSIRVLHHKSDSAVAVARHYKADAVVLRGRIAKAPTAIDSLPIAMEAWHYLEVAVDSLESARRSDSLQIIVLTGDRDKWKFEADSLHKAMLRLNSNVGQIATVAKKQVDLGFIKVPADAAKMALAGLAGYGLAKAF